MAVFKKFSIIRNGTRYESGLTDTGLVFNPNGDNVWINDVPHDFNNLYPMFKKDCNALKSFKSMSDSTGFIDTSIVTSNPCLINGQTTGTVASHGSEMGSYYMSSRDCNLEDDKVLKMSTRTFHWQSSGSKDFYLNTQYTHSGTYPVGLTQVLLIEGNDWSNPDAIAKYGNYRNTGADYSVDGSSLPKYMSYNTPIHVDVSNKTIYFRTYGTGNGNDSSSYTAWRTKSNSSRIHKVTYTSVEDDGTLALSSSLTEVLRENSLSTTNNYGNGTFYYMESNNFYYCGRNLDNSLMFVELTETATQGGSQISARASGLLTCESVNPSNGTVSNVSTVAVSGLTDSAAAGKPMIRPRPSQFKNSPISGETNIYYSYYPVCSSSGVISFLLMTWDRSANSNAGSMTIDNCTMTYNSGVATDYFEYPTTSNSDTGAKTRSNSWITTSGGNYYLHYLPSYGNAAGCAGQSGLAKTLVSFQIDATDFSSLTYHSSFQIESHDFVHLTSDRQKIGVITPGSAKVLTWNNGWSETASESGSFVALTQDTAGRIFGISGRADNTTSVEAPNMSGTGYSEIEQKVVLISDSLPSTVTVEFANSSLTYSGSNLTTSVNVNAYDTNNARVAKSVELKIDGSNAQFTSNSGSTLTTTTSTSADTNVGLTITGPGPVLVSAAFNL